MLPFVGWAFLTYILVKAIIVYSAPHAGYASPFLGIGSPVAIAILMVILGIVFMLIQRVTMPELLQRQQTKRRRSGDPRRRARGAPVMSRGIVVGYDGSACAKEALRVGLEVGKAYGEQVIVAFGYELNPVAGEIHDYHQARQGDGDPAPAGGRIARARRRGRASRSRP